MRARLFYILTGGKVRGPFPEQGIIQLAKEGKLPADAQISEDERHWYAPGAVLPLAPSHIAETQARVAPSPPRPPLIPKTFRAIPLRFDLTEIWKHKGIIFVAAAACSVLLLIGLLVLNWQKPSSELSDSRSHDGTLYGNPEGVQSGLDEGTPEPAQETTVSGEDECDTQTSPGQPPSETAANNVQPSASEYETEPPGWLEQLQKATVSVITDKGTGSGFFIHDQAGGFLLVTNNHVVEGARVIQAQLHDGTMVDVRRGALYPQFDLAFLAVDGLEQPPAVLTLRNELPKLAEKVFAYGAPRRLTGTITEGIVSSVRTTMEISQQLGECPYDKEMHWIQTSAPMSPGNSGGPLVDSRGRVIGVNTWGLSEGQNLNFAVSAQQIVALLPELQMASLPPTQRQAPEADNDNAILARATLEYWWAMKTALQVWQSLNSDLGRLEQVSPAKQARILRNLAASCAGMIAYLNDLDDSNVDREAIKCKDAICDLMNTVLEFLNVLAHRSSPNLVTEAMNKLESTQVRLNVAESTARQNLSRRYGVPFPSLFDEE